MTTVMMLPCNWYCNDDTMFPSKQQALAVMSKTPKFIVGCLRKFTGTNTLLEADLSYREESFLLVSLCVLVASVEMLSQIPKQSASQACLLVYN